jgi:hypothetical protein
LNAVSEITTAPVPSGRLGSLIVGGGPAGVALLVAAQRSGRLAALMAGGLRVLERGARIGSGQIGRYAIRSDSLADSFLRALDLEEPSLFRSLIARPPGRDLYAQRGRAVRLSLVGEFLAEIALTLRDTLRASGEDPFSTGVAALRAECQPDGSWMTFCRRVDGRGAIFHADTLVLATGAHQPLQRLQTQQVAGAPLLPHFAPKLLQSADFLSHDMSHRLKEITPCRPLRRIAIVGGSHSALASAHRCLHDLHPEFRDCESVTVLHRNRLHLTYPSVESALQDGYETFSPEDVCRKTGRVFPLAGFRSDARDLLRRHLELGQLKRDPRLRLLELTEQAGHHEAQRVLENADLIVAALGYQPRALPLFDCEKRPVALLCETARRPLVDRQSRVLDASGRPIPRVFGIGLAAGYPLGGVHGEASFTGEANGLALWQTDIGSDLIERLLTLRLKSVDSHPC